MDARVNHDGNRNNKKETDLADGPSPDGPNPVKTDTEPLRFMRNAPRTLRQEGERMTIKEPPPPNSPRLRSREGGAPCNPFTYPPFGCTKEGPAFSHSPLLGWIPAHSTGSTPLGPRRYKQTRGCREGWARATCHCRTSRSCLSAGTRLGSRSPPKPH